MKPLVSPALSALALASLALPCGAQWSTDPAVNQTVADAAGTQNQTKLAPTADGGCYISWFDGGSGWDVRLQRLDALGNEAFPHGGVLVADRGFSSTQDYGLGLDMAGNALLTYRDDSGTGIQVAAAKVSPAGGLLWGAGGVQLTSTTAFIGNMKISGTTDGGSVVAWSQDGEMHVQKLDASGVPQWVADVVLSPAVGSYSIGDLHAHGTDAILSIVWQTGAFGSPNDLLAQKFDLGGAPLWGAAPLSVFDDGSLQFANFPSFVPDGAGGAVFAWYNTAGGLQCTVQRVLASGAEAFAHNGVDVSTDATRTRVSPSASFDDVSGEITVFWEEMNAGQSQSGVYGQKLDMGGNRLWGSEGAVVVPINASDLTQVRTVPVSAGALVFWNDSPGFNQDQLHGARVTPAGVVDIAPIVVTSTTSAKARLAAAASTSGFAILAWSDKRTDDGDILAQAITADGVLGGASITTNYCPLTPNSAGPGAAISATGSPSVLANDLVISVSGAVNDAGVFFYGTGQGQIPFGNGNRCVTGTIVRLWPPSVADALGNNSRVIDNTHPGIAGSLAPIVDMATLNFQYWFRDPAGGGMGFNLSDAIEITFTP